MYLYLFKYVVIYLWQEAYIVYYKNIDICSMCYSAEASFISLCIGLLGSIGVYTLNTMFDKIFALFLGYVSLMQGIELILWNNQKCDAFHKRISFLGMLLNLSQPLILAIIILLISNRNEFKLYIGVIIFLYSIYGLYFIDSYKTELQCTNPRPNDPHLVWNWTILPRWWLDHLIYIITFSIISILGMPSLNQGLIFAGGLTVSMVISSIVYPRENMGSMWCFISALSPPLFYLYRKIGFYQPV